MTIARLLAIYIVAIAVLAIIARPGFAHLDERLSRASFRAIETTGESVARIQQQHVGLPAGLAQPSQQQQSVKLRQLGIQNGYVVGAGLHAPQRLSDVGRHIELSTTE